MIKNYTSQVTVEKSIQKIETRLIACGAKIVTKTANMGKINGISFVMNVNGSDIPFRLPARINNVEKKLLSLMSRPRTGTKKRILEQAERTAWKLLADWIDVQMSLIELDQAEFAEVFMPYMYDYKKEQTLFERIKSDGFKLLEYK